MMDDPTMVAAASNLSVPNGIRSLLDVLRSQSSVDVDSLDSTFAAGLAPFVDATSNQAIAFAELSKPAHQALLLQACRVAAEEAPRWPELTLPALATEVAQILLALKMAPNLTGRFHLQANPLDAYSVNHTVRCGERLTSLVSTLSSPAEAQRLCLKVAATWEGLMACRALEKEKGIRTLATTLFTMEQGVLAAEVGCAYVAPYVNELPVHFVPGHIDPAPNNQLVVDLQRYYETHSIATQVLPASLTTVAECMYLAGAQHITISPPLLQALSSTPAPSSAQELDTAYPSLFKQTATTNQASSAADAASKQLTFIDDEAFYRLSVTRRDAGRQEKKLVDAINIFADMQVKLEELMTGAMHAAAAAQAA